MNVCSIKDITNRLGISKQAVWEDIQKGNLKAELINVQYVIDKSEADRYIREKLENRAKRKYKN